MEGPPSKEKSKSGEYDQVHVFHDIVVHSNSPITWDNGVRSLSGEWPSPANLVSGGIRFQHRLHQLRMNREARGLNHRARHRVSHKRDETGEDRFLIVFKTCTGFEPATNRVSTSCSTIELALPSSHGRNPWGIPSGPRGGEKSKEKRPVSSMKGDGSRLKLNHGENLTSGMAPSHRCRGYS